MKIIWKVRPAPTGRYRSFEKRGWPDAEYEDGQPAASVSCEDDYIPRDVKTGHHRELTVRIADYSEKPVWGWKRLKKRFATLQEAKEIVPIFLKQYPNFVPEKYR